MQNITFTIIRHLLKRCKSTFCKKMVDNCLIAVFETKKEPAFLQVLVELMTRFELVTSSLPIAIIAHGVLKLCLSWFRTHLKLYP